MKLILRKTNLLYLDPATQLPIERIRMNLDTSEVQEKGPYWIKFNKDPYLPFERNMRIPKEYYKKHSLVITIANNDFSQVYVSDIVPVTSVVYLGKSIDDAYPEAFKHLEARMDSYDAEVKRLHAKLKELSELNDLL